MDREGCESFFAGIHGFFQVTAISSRDSHDQRYLGVITDVFEQISFPIIPNNGG